MAFPAVPRNAKSYDIENAINRILRWLNPGFGADNAGKVLTSNSTGTDLEWAAVPHNLLQMVSFSTGALATGTTLIPVDNTKPQNTEGDQYMSLAVTPKSATSKLLVTVTFIGTVNKVTNLVVALFQDTTADALASDFVFCDTLAGVRSISFSAVVEPGSTDETTFKVRAGGQTGSAATTTFNGSAGSQFMGGSLASSIVIQEFAG